MKLFHYKYVGYIKATDDKKARVCSLAGWLWASEPKDVEEGVMRRVASEIENPASEDLSIDQVNIPLLLKQGVQYAWLEIKWAVIDFFTFK